MAEFNEARSPLTTANVQSWARQAFAVPFRALPRPAKMQWIEFDESSFVISRSTWRSLGRSAHKQLLVIGGYSPGSNVDDEPTDCVAAHVHMDDAEVSFYRIAAVRGGRDELHPVNSTSTVAFHAPFCDVGEDTGGSEAIHRVSSLILYYFLAAGHVQELLRTKSAPTMFTRNFRDACFWIANRGERPVEPPSRRSSGTTSTLQSDDVSVRPKRSSTITSMSRYGAEPPPQFKRSATDDVTMKREFIDKTPGYSRKHPRRTLSEQIHIPKLLSHESSTSPRSPAPERVNRALSDRIQHLKNENADLRQRMAHEQQTHHDEGEQLKNELTDVKARLASVESESEHLRSEMEFLRRRLDRAEEDAVAAKDEPIVLRKGPIKKPPGPMKK
ncbi:hypothetical protein BKA66DRAFT_476826 [Pyrenochaeta sp. MPI-SDFR-AT-0127]|nr:hypothetical protein BKA66DRAFT_476826 [Pyrenochaeta sp. MPI-SDFR-AT-0127]